MSDTVVTPEDLLANAESLQQSIDQAVPEASNVQLPAARRTPSMRPYYALLAAAILTPALLFGIVAWQYREFMLRNAISDVERTLELSVSQVHDLLQIDQLLAERVNEYTRGMTWDEIQHSEALHNYLKRLAAEYPQAGVLFLMDEFRHWASIEPGIPPAAGFRGGSRLFQSAAGRQRRRRPRGHVAGQDRRPAQLQSRDTA